MRVCVCALLTALWLRALSKLHFSFCYFSSSWLPHVISLMRFLLRGWFHDFSRSHAKLNSMNELCVGVRNPVWSSYVIFFKAKHVHWRRDNIVRGKLNRVNCDGVQLSCLVLLEICKYGAIMLQLSFSLFLSPPPPPPTCRFHFKGKLHSKIISSDMIEFFP